MSEQTPQDIDALLLGQTKGLDAGRMNRRSFEIATREWARAGIVCPLLVVCAAHFVLTRQMHAEDTTEHPFIQASAIKSETCLTCHPNKKEGKFVHSAIAMGCEKCHRAISENGKTTITPVATGGELCAMCHDAKRAPVLHVPYREGQCLLCHEPHTSNFPRQVRAETNLLCLSCHVPHSSALSDLLPADVNNDFELCARCHKWGARRRAEASGNFASDSHRVPNGKTANDGSLVNFNLNIVAPKVPRCREMQVPARHN